MHTHVSRLMDPRQVSLKHFKLKMVKHLMFYQKLTFATCCLIYRYVLTTTKSDQCIYVMDCNSV